MPKTVSHLLLISLVLQNGIHVLYSFILFLQEYIKPFITSMTSMDTAHVLEAVKNARG